jgi:diaminopimelate decarboxylase
MNYNFLTKDLILAAAREFDTPLYLYDADLIRARYQLLRRIAPTDMDIFYSLKANPLLGIAEIIRQEDGCCEVCSAAELELALKAGFKPQRIIFVGPGKSLVELTLAVTHKIYAIACESLAEIKKINALGEKHNLIVPILLRINPDFISADAPLKMGGNATQFGIDLSALQQQLPEILTLPQIKIRGIHVYNGTRILNAKTIIQNTKNILQLAEKLITTWNIDFECIDIGGGLGIPYFANEQELAVNIVFTELKLLIADYQAKYGKVRFILECGRYLVGESGIMVSQVVDAKKSHNENFLITDGGMNCHMAATGIGSFMRRNFPISMLAQKNTLAQEQNLVTYNITGPLCTPGDLIAKQVQLPATHVGDLILIHFAGAYGASASPGRFLSHGYPAEVLCAANQFYLLKRRETSADILLTQYSYLNTSGENSNEPHPTNYCSIS